ncbi:MAG: hypothetical protein U0230_28155 [Polyangiales bacterium]
MFAILGSALIFAMVSRLLPRKSHSILWKAFAARIFFSFAQTAIYAWYYGSGDMYMYMDVGGRFASITARDPVTYLPQLLGACIGITPSRGLAFEGTGTTANMQAIVAVFRLFHDSIWAVGFWFGLLSFAAQAFAYHGAIRLVGERYERYVRLAFLYTPSVAFWSASITKETVAIAGLSLVLYGVSSWSHSGVPAGLVSTFLGALILVISKPFILIPLGISIAVFAMRKQRADLPRKVNPLFRSLRPFALAALAVGSVIVPGMLFPQLRPEKVVETANYRRTVAYGQGASDLSPARSEADDEFGLAYIPVGLTAALFRPFFFEARNLTQLLNVLETTAILYLVLRVVFRTGLRGIYRKILRHPELTFCIAFTLMTALAVGMSNPNLGTISRYRAPMMPFYVLALLILNESARRPPRGQDLPASAGGTVEGTARLAAAVGGAGPARRRQNWK